MVKGDSTIQESRAEQQLPEIISTEEISQISVLVPSAGTQENNPATLDCLTPHQKHIMDRLEGIRRNKERILSALRDLKEGAKEGELPNKELMSKMIASYDALTAQEEQYVQLIQKIVSLHENAAEDVEHGSERNGKKSTVSSDSNTEGFVKHGIIVKNGIGSSNNKSSDEAVDIDFEEMNNELSKLGVLTGKAVAVSAVNDKLLETLQLHHEKKAALEELHRRKRETQKDIANEALQQVEMARLKVASEQEQVERKRKTLERLRREARRRGIRLGPGSASEPDIIVEPQPEPKSVTEAKLRAKLQAKKKQNTELEGDIGPPIPNDLAPAERIPRILESEPDKLEKQQQKEKSTTREMNGGSSGVVGKKKKKGRKGREEQEQQLARKQSDTINSSIREKLAAITARKERMREIRAQLVQPVAPSSPDMDETFRSALQQLKSITEMRKQLELLREKGDDLPKETARLLERQLEAEENATKQSEASNPVIKQDSDIPFEESSEAMEAVRNSFFKVIAQKSRSDTGIDMSGNVIRDDLSVGYRLTTEDSQRLKNIEQALQEQRHLLETIALQSHQHRLSRSDTTESCQMKIATLRKYFLNATPQLLVRFGNILLDLSKGQLVHELDSVLTDLLQNGNDRQLPGDTDEHGNDISDRSREIASIESEPQEAAELIKPIRAESVSQFERGLSRELTPDEASKFEQAKRQLSTGKAKLRKQQTLEKVRNRTEIVADEQHQQMQKQDIERVEGLENDICMIIDGILPRIREHSEVVADDGFMRQLRDELLHQASMVCFPGDAAPTDLFRSQLSTIVDDTLSQYVGAKVGEVREELIFDTSEILYNELAFFQLMCNIDNLAL